MESQLIPYVATTSFRLRRVLVLAPHPDDEVFGCGGAILRLITEGSAIQVIILTDGDFQPHVPDSGEYARTRREESCKAAQVLGYGTPIFWGLQDRGIEYGEQLIQRIADHIEAFVPDGVFAPSVLEMHPDHRALGMAAMEAVRRHGSELQLVMYEVGVPMPRPNILLDISNLVQRKRDAIACFVSQLRVQAYDQQIPALNCFRSYTLGSQVTAAEAYLMVRTCDLERDSLELYESEYQRQRSLGLPMMPKDIPLVSVIVCVQTGQSPRNALDSIALQTYSHIEVIMVCSQDETPNEASSTCGRFPLNFIHVDCGMTHAMRANTGVKHAAGAYLIFLEAGDLFLPNHLTKLIDTLIDSTEHVACTGVKFVDQQGGCVAVFDEPWDVGLLQTGNAPPLLVVLFSRECVESGCQFREVLGRIDHREYLLQLAARTKFLYTPGVSAVCQRHPSHLVHIVENRRLQSVLNTTQEELTKATNQRAANQQRTEEMEMQLGQLRTQVSQLAASTATQAAQVHSLEHTVQALHASTSWKITSPLRFLSRMRKGLE